LTETPQPLCADPAQILAFMELLRTVTSFVPVPLFASAKDFLDFESGTGRVYAILNGFLAGMGMQSLVAWTPVVMTPQQRQSMESAFLVEAQIHTIQSTAYVGRARAKMTVVVNFDRPWTPPPGVAGSLPALGVLHHYRLE
jgi:hypothetical protein